jgi:chemotaxis signal transduction protein
MIEQEIYLLFYLKGGLYAIELCYVQQVIRLKPEHFTQSGNIRGVLPYRGRELPVIDLCYLFRQQNLLSMGEGIILFPTEACLLVEQVLDIWEIETPLQTLSKEFQKTQYFLSTTTKNQQVVLILDIPHLLQHIPED